MKPVAPCRGCEERYLGCHDQCKRYAAYKKAAEEWVAKVRESKEEYVADEVLIRLKRKAGGKRK